MAHQRSMFGVLRDALQSRDPVTGTLRAAAFERAVHSWLGDGARTRRPASSLLMIRLDWEVRDGDVRRPARRQLDGFLRSATEAAAACIRGTDVLGRLDDDTLGLLLPSTPLDQAEQVADRIRVTVEALETRDGHRATVSIGLASGLSTDPWADAFSALDDAQFEGGDQVVVARPPHAPR